jgi:putative transcriptional regulator
MVVKRVSVEDARAVLAAVDRAKVDAAAEMPMDEQLALDPDTTSEMTDEQVATAKVAYRVRLLRQSRGYSQPQFASAYGLPVGTVRDWEQGRTRPDGPALTLLAIIEAMPIEVERVLAERRAG